MKTNYYTCKRKWGIKMLAFLTNVNKIGMIGPSTGLCLRNIQQSQETNIHVSVGIRTRNPENPAAADTPELSFGKKKGRNWFC